MLSSIFLNVDFAHKLEGTYFEKGKTLCRTAPICFTPSEKNLFSHKNSQKKHERHYD